MSYKKAQQDTEYGTIVFRVSHCDRCHHEVASEATAGWVVFEVTTGGHMGPDLIRNVDLCPECRDAMVAVLDVEIPTVERGRVDDNVVVT